MKIKRFSFLVLVTLLFIGCGKDQLFIQRAVMEAKSRGVHWVADKSVYAFYTTNPKQLLLYGASNDWRTFCVVIQQEDTIPHWFPFTPGMNNCAIYKDLENDCNDKFYQTLGSANASGLLILSKEDTIARRLSGTFRFKAFRADGDSAIITSGIFADVQYNMGQLYGNTFVASVGGTPWTPIDVACDYRNSIRITALGADLSMFVVDLPKDVKPGKYPLASSTNYVAIYEPNLVNPDTQISASGEVEIITHNTTDKTITGKVKFTGKSTLGTQTEITDGVFSVKYD